MTFPTVPVDLYAELRLGMNPPSERSNTTGMNHGAGPSTDSGNSRLSARAARMSATCRRYHDDEIAPPNAFRSSRDTGPYFDHQCHAHAELAHIGPIGIQGPNRPARF